MEKLIFKSYCDLTNDIKRNIHLLTQEGFDLIVGIPRSGMIPAYMISAYLNLDCTTLDAFINNEPLQRGITRNTKGKLAKPHDAKKILLVDDSVYSGDSLKLSISKIPDSLWKKVKSAVIYAHPDSKGLVDFYFELTDGKKLFEWGIFHNNIIQNSCFDIDGVLCLDPTIEQDDDGVQYENFIKNASPKFLPTNKIHSIVSNRLEKYRTLTEEWLKKYNVRYDHLILAPLPDKKSRENIDLAIECKAKYYKKSKTDLFIESSFEQAERIAVFSGKPVYCTDTNTYFEPSNMNKIIKNPLGFYEVQKNYYKHKIKMFLRVFFSK